MDIYSLRRCLRMIRDINTLPSTYLQHELTAADIAHAYVLKGNSNRNIRKCKRINRHGSHFRTKSSNVNHRPIIVPRSVTYSKSVQNRNSIIGGDEKSIYPKRKSTNNKKPPTKSTVEIPETVRAESSVSE